MRHCKECEKMLQFVAKNMLINILDLSRKPEGTQDTRAIHIDTLEDVDLAKPFEAQVEVMVITPQHFSVHTRASLVVNRTCDRCLKPYEYPLSLDFTQEFADDSDDADWPIVNNQIDVLEPIRQEVLLNIPMKSLCSPDCKGILEPH